MLFGKKHYENMEQMEYFDGYYNGNADHQLVDVRTPAEYAGGHVPGAISIPLNELNDRVDEIATDKPVVIICQSGGRSAKAAQALGKAGYENLYNLKGGTGTWMMAGRDIER